MWCQPTARPCNHRRIAVLISPVPLSLATVRGSPRASGRPDSAASAIRSRNFRAPSSSTYNIRSSRLSASIAIDVRVTTARLRLPQRLICIRPSGWRRRGFLWSDTNPRREIENLRHRHPNRSRSCARARSRARPIAPPDRPTPHGRPVGRHHRTLDARSRCDAHPGEPWWPTALCLPAGRRRDDPVLAAYIRHHRPALMLLQHASDLLLCKPHTLPNYPLPAQVDPTWNWQKLRAHITVFNVCRARPSPS